MTQIVITINSPDTTATINQRLNQRRSDRGGNFAKLESYINGCKGNIFPTLPAAITTGSVASTATITFAGQPTNNQTITINGVVFTAKTSGATGDEFNIGSNYAETMINLVNAIKASTTSGIEKLSVSFTGFVITLTSALAGTLGNALTLAKTLTNVTISGATFTGGVDGTTLVM